MGRRAPDTQMEESQTERALACSFSTHSFETAFNDTLIYAHVINMRGSLFAWVGDAPPKLGSLVLALQTKWDTLPTATTILGKHDCEWSIPMAQRISKKIQSGLFLSCALPTAGVGEEFKQFVERWLREQILTVVHI